MWANFTEETCTGTGATLVLTGITTGNIPFAASFADGDFISYVLEDSGGTIKIAGIGTYVSATDDITRNDTWNWNGTVIDENPSTNITLGGGTHTIRCATYSETTGGVQRIKATSGGTTFPVFPDNVTSLAAGAALSADFGYFMQVYMLGAMEFSKIWYNVTTSDGSGTGEMGIFSVDETGRPVKLIAKATLTITSTGRKLDSVGSTIILKPGRYCVGVVTNSSTVVFDRYSSAGGGVTGWYVFRGAPTVTRLDLGQATFPADLSSQARFDTDPLNSAAIGFGS